MSFVAVNVQYLVHQLEDLVAQIPCDRDGEASQTLGKVDHLRRREQGFSQACLPDEPQDVQGRDIGLPQTREAELGPRVQALARVRLALRAQVQNSAGIHAGALQAVDGAQTILW